MRVPHARERVGSTWLLTISACAVASAVDERAGRPRGQLDDARSARGQPAAHVSAAR